MKSALLKFSTSSTHQVSVRVYKTRAAMRSLTSRWGHEKPNRTDGMCFQANKPGKDQIVAEIHLAETHLTLETIAHECAHAAWHRVRLMGLPLDDEEFQEYLAASTGLMTDTLLAWCDQQKLRVKLNCVPTRRIFTSRA